MSLDDYLAEWHNDSDTVLVHTSGSTGSPKPLLVEKRRMEASARITCQFLGLKEGDTALLCLPLDYIAGKMMVVRAITCGLRLVDVPPSGHPLSLLPDTDLTFAAMVPLQVFNSLQVPEERKRLMAIRHLIIGGGAVDETLSRELSEFPNAVWSTYGMTETLSHIALRRLNGDEASEWYTPFASVSVSQSANGCLVIDAPQVSSERLITRDVAEVRPDGRFRILGRIDNVACSGGLKIQMEEVERMLKPHLRGAFLVTKRHDKRLGEALTLLTEEDPVSMEEICRRVLPKHWQPRYYMQVKHIPMTETGKPARHLAQEIAERG
jgi:O-succinylbenzoic acid--CoA ligase